MSGKAITRRPWFWVAHSLFFLLCVLYAWRNFEGAFPFVQLDVKMDRAEALSSARTLGAGLGWLPAAGGREAASFESDSGTQNFIELEAGGPAELKQVLKDGIYAPYTWRVRHFAEGQVNEATIHFTPAGKPWGYLQKLSEDLPGARLEPGDARRLAEKAAARDWGVDFAPYKLVEQSSEKRKSGRVDHALIYERAAPTVGEGRYRLKLVVSGDRLTEVNRFIRVPEAFYRRYSAMRSANATLAQLAGAAVVLLYGLGLCGFGLFALARSHWVQWRFPVLLAGVIAGLHFLDELNRLPLEWMDYDTAISAQAFVLKLVAGAALTSLLDFVLVVIPLIAAESLSRRAFPEQPQLWRIFSRDARGTRAVAGRVFGAYLFVGFHFAWVVFIYRLGSERLGWWNPSELLFHPDELATYFPWLTSVANSLHAGVWEECLFRAVPLAGAALIGSRLGGRKGWLAGAFVLQAVIFGSAHASYPTQPSYARLVELVVPSSVFGGVYLAFGLLPGILMHYTYDVTLFAMPLFLSTGASAMVNRVIVIALSLAPLGWVGAAWFRQGGLRELGAGFFNRAWDPAAQAARAEEARARRARAAAALAPVTAFTRGQRRVLAGSGLLALALWAWCALRPADAPSLRVDRARAVSLARERLERQGVKPDPATEALALAEGAPDEEDSFVWRTQGPARYAQLMGSYLEPPHWKVRFARFSGDLLERADERQVFVQGAGEIERVRHELPESRAGASLDEPQARALAEKALREQYALDPSALEQVASQESQLPARRDWTFIWRVPAEKLEQGGEARVAVKISGEEQVGYRKMIHAPEEWLRAERGRKITMGVVRLLGRAVLAFVALWICFRAFRAWVGGRFNSRVFARAFAGLLAVEAVLIFNRFPMEVAQFNTAQSWSSQALRSIVTDILIALLRAGAAALCLGQLHAPEGAPAAAPAERPWIGYASGAWITAIGAAAALLSRGEEPLWPSVAAASARLPWLESLGSLSTLVSAAALLMLLFPWLEGAARSRLRRGLAAAALGLALGAQLTEGSPLQWLAAGAAATLVVLALGRLSARGSAAQLLPVAAAGVCLRAARLAWLNPYPGAVAGAILLAGGALLLSWFWFAALERHSRTSSSAG